MMAEINLTFNLPGVTAEELTAALAPLLGTPAISQSPTVIPNSSKDPEEFISLRTAAEECPLSSYCLRERIVDGEEIPYSRKGKSKKSPIIIKRKHLWLLFPDLTATSPKKPAGRPSGTITPEDIALGNC